MWMMGFDKRFNEEVIAKSCRCGGIAVIVLLNSGLVQAFNLFYSRTKSKVLPTFFKKKLSQI